MHARRRLAAVVVLAMAAFVLLVRPVGAAFTGSTSSSGNSFVSVADFETGSLLTWGSTNRAQTVPARVDSSTGWTASAIGSVSECEIRSPGTLWCWGSNTSGQLGLGDTTTRTVPTQVGTETTWTSVSEGNSYACATRSDGTLWCWGSATYGGLGNGGTATQTSPTQVTSPSTTGWGPVSVGYGATCSTRTDTTLWCWGDNQNAQIGDGTSTNRPSPTQVTTPSATGWSSVANGDRHTCAIRTGNLLYCWGNNSYGQLGQGNAANSSTPIQVPGTTWSALAAGQFHSCATKTDGSLWCWGQNTTGQVGNGTTTNATSPARVGTGTSWSRVAAARQHTCAGQSDSTLWCWGLNGNGQLGDGTLTARTTPVQVVVPFPTGWSLTELGAEASRTCATRADSSLWCWGAGYGTVVYPALLDGTSTWRKPSNGLNFACALRTTGALLCWGSNGSGQVGDNTTTTRLVPTQVGTSTAWTALSSGQAHSCAIRSDTTLWCWGLNTYGQLGLGSTTQQNSPVQVTTPATGGWAQVSAGNGSTCAIRTDGSLYCWGNDAGGQLGDGGTTEQNSPVPVTTPAAGGWTSVTVGSSFACGLRLSTLYCWGVNSNGQLGIGTTTGATTPTAVAGTWSSVSAGTFHTCAIATAATLWCWGNGGNGRLGTGNTTTIKSPAQVGTANDWHTVSAATTFTCGTRAGPATWCWGQDNLGQLGLSDLTDRTTPQLLPVSGRPVEADSESNGTSLIQPQ